MRFEVWFNNGLFRAFPNVDTNTIKRTNEYLSFIFGKNQDHRANINMNNVNFLEEMKDSEEES